MAGWSGRFLVRRVQVARGARRIARGDPRAGGEEIAPYAAEVDENSAVPAGSLRCAEGSTSTRCTCPRSTAARVRTRSPACIVIEEVARACASSSLIPAVNKLGSMPADPAAAPRS